MAEQNLTKRERRNIRREEKLQARAEQAKKRKTKRVITWLVAIIVIVIAGYGVSQFGGHSSNNTDGSKIADVDEVVAGDWVKGNPEAQVTLVEYSDFQCPACASFFPMIKRLEEEFGQDLRIVYRHFPLAQIHPFAELAGRAAEAAGKQGKFWEMHDLLFENQTTWSRGSARDMFTSFAEQLELNVDQFQQDMDSKEAKDEVRNNYSSGLRAGVNSTPSFFLNGQKLSNPRSFAEFAALIQATIDEVKPLEFESLPNNEIEETENNKENVIHIGEPEEEPGEESMRENHE
jgi:protein-disulfide isomerase